MTDLGARLQKSLSPLYIVERELGGGGMSRVFLAEELALRRRVVIKVLPEDLALSVNADRFRREISIAARLTHPHIVPLLTAGEVDGRPYYVMPYVDGETLRARMSRSRMSFAEAVRLLRQIVSALAMAHEKGIVHRDIKPENVLLAGDAAFIIDFGVAKALADAAVDSANGLTETGLALGTPAYMAPEQALGEASTDHRADIYAFGCLAYELLSGAPPFKGSGSAQVLAAQISTAPAPLESMSPPVPLPLARLVMRCLEKDPSQRPQSAQAIARDLDAIHSGLGLAPTDSSLRWRVRGRWGRAAVVVGLLAVVLVAGGYAVRSVATRLGARAPLLVVLPLEDQGPDSTRYFVDGLGGAISDRLASVAGVRVIDHQSATSVAKPGRTVKQMGAELGADYALRGAVRWDFTSPAPRAQLTVSLITVSDGTTKWQSEPMIFLPASDPFEVQRKVSVAVAEALNVALTANDRSALADRPTKNPAAYDAYLRGVSRYERAVSQNDFAQAAANLAEAVQLDPDFQLARARWVTVATAGLAESGGSVTADSIQRAVDVLTRRSPGAPTTLLAEAALASLRGDSSALGTLRRAARSAPNNPIILYQTALEVMSRDAHPADAWPLLERASQLAPRNVEVLVVAAFGALRLRRLSDVRALLARLRSLDPQNPYVTYYATSLAAAEGDSAGVLEAFETGRSNAARPTAGTATALLFGGAASLDTLAKLSFADLAIYSPLSDTVEVLLAQGFARVARGEPANARARAVFQQTYETSSATRLPGTRSGDAAVLRSRALAAAAVNDRAVTEQALSTLRNSLRDFPSQSGAASGLACRSAEAYALLRDTTAMYPQLEQCAGGATGDQIAYYPSTIVRYPPYAAYRQQPHFQRVVRSLAEGVKR